MTVFLIIILAIIVVILGASYICYYMAFHSPDKQQNDIHNIPKGEQYDLLHDSVLNMINEFAAYPYEQLFITSHDGLRLAAKYYHSKDNAPLAICFHGYRSTSIRDFCGIGAFCLASGQNLLIVDQRAQGLSSGHTMTFGVKEKMDCLDWIKYAVKRFGGNTSIILYGLSMGAATVLMASGMRLPPNVRAVIADSPYNSIKSILKKVCRDMGLPPDVIYPFLFIGARIYGHFSISTGELSTAVANSHIPILIIHGEGDSLVPCQMSRQLCASNPEKVHLMTFTGAEHGISYLKDKQRYHQAVTDFLKSL